MTTSSTGYIFPPDIYEVSDIIFMLDSLLSDEVKVKITNDDIKLRWNLTINKTLRFTKKTFFYTILGFTQSHSGLIGDIKVSFN